MRSLLALALLAANLQAAVTIKYVRSSGGDYAATLAGLQDAVDDAAASSSTDPWVIDVEANVEYSDGSACYLTLPAQSTVKLIVIRSSRIGELPDGVRVTAADAAKLFRIKNSCASSQAVILAAPEITGTPGTAVSSHYVIQGCEAWYAGEGRNAGGAINIGYDPTTTIKAKAHWQFPHAITIDRCWVHGNDTETWITASSTHANQSGIRVDGRNITIKNSRLSDNNMDSVDHGQGESRGIAGSNAPGPLYVLNNYIDGAIGSIIGGEQPWLPGLVFTGGWFYGNEYSRTPWAWHWTDYAGTCCGAEQSFTAGATTATVTDNYGTSVKVGACYIRNAGDTDWEVLTTSGATFNTNDVVFTFSAAARNGKCTVDYTLNPSEPCISGAFWEQKDRPYAKWKCDAGTWTTSSDNRVNRPWVKNGWECKNCRMVTVEGNYIHDIASTGDQSQYGYAFLINNVDSYTGNAQDATLYARPEHIGIRYNRVRRTGQGPTISWSGNAAIFRKTNNIAIEHNVFEAMAGPRVSPTQGTAVTSGGGTQLQVSGVSDNLRFSKNTFLYDRSFSGIGLKLADSAPLVSNVDLRDNILYWGFAAQTPLDNFSESCASLQGVMQGAVYWDYFGLVDTNSKGSTAFTTLFGGAQCPSNVSRAATYADVKFVNYNSGEDGDYRLCAGTDTPAAGCTASPWATAASDGGPLGADALQVSRMSAGAVSGTYDPGLFAMQITAASATQIRYTPYHPAGACTVTVTRLSTGDVTTNSDDEGFGGAVVRYIIPTIPAIGEYEVRITCKDASGTVKGWRARRFKSLI